MNIEKNYIQAYGYYTGIISSLILRTQIKALNLGVDYETSIELRNYIEEMITEINEGAEEVLTGEF